MNTLDGSVPPCLSLLVGTSGHRDIRPDDVPILEERVGMLLDLFRQHYPSSPLAVLTSLAEGADRLTARVALSLGIAFMQYCLCLLPTIVVTSQSRCQLMNLISFWHTASV